MGLAGCSELREAVPSIGDRRRFADRGDHNFWAASAIQPLDVGIEPHKHAVRARVGPQHAGLRGPGDPALTGPAPAARGPRQARRERLTATRREVRPHLCDAYEDAPCDAYRDAPCDAYGDTVGAAGRGRAAPAQMRSGPRPVGHRMAD